MKVIVIILKLYLFSMFPIGIIFYGITYSKEKLVSGLFLVLLGIIFLIFTTIEALKKK